MARICMLLTGKPWWERRHFHRQAPALAEGGHDVIYVCGDPGKPVDVPFRIHPLARWQRRISRPIGTLHLFPLVLRLKPDALHLVSLDQLPLGLVVKALTRIKVVYDCREDMYHSMRDHKPQFPRWLRGVLAWWTRWLERRAAKHFDAIVASDPAIAAIHEAMPDERKLVYFNVPLLSLFPRDYPPLEQRDFDVTVLGSMSGRTGILDVIEAVGLLRSGGTRIRVLLVGQPNHEVLEPIQRRAAELGFADDLNVTGRVPHEEVAAWLRKAKVGVVPLLDMPKFRNNIACKAFEYMASGMPVIASDLPPQRIILREGETGAFYPPGDPKALAQRLESFLGDPARLQKMGEEARDDVERRWNARHEQEKLRDFYQRILGGGPDTPDVESVAVAPKSDTVDARP